MPSISLRICFVDSRWAWYLRDQDEIDVYAGAQLVTTLRADVLRQLVSHYLAHASLTATILEGPGTIRKPLRTAPPRSALPPAGVPAWGIQEARKAKRHARLGRPRKRRSA